MHKELHYWMPAQGKTKSTITQNMQFAIELHTSYTRDASNSMI
jgi:hypothetical protein